MRKLTTIAIAAFAALMAAPAIAADYPEPPIYIPPLPPVDYGLEGAFYLRGSLGGNIWTATDIVNCGCFTTFSSPGYGYSVGAGIGYEVGNGLRADLTIDYLSNNGLTATNDYTINLRSGLVLANAYYDIALSEYSSVGGGFGAYVGAGAGFALNYSEIYDTVPDQYAWGTSVEAAAALMAGVTYDMGNVVADLGYRGVYMNKVMSQPASMANSYVINNNWIHEVRGTVRYRFN